MPTFHVVWPKVKNVWIQKSDRLFMTRPSNQKYFLSVRFLLIGLTYYFSKEPKNKYLNFLKKYLWSIHILNCPGKKDRHSIRGWLWHSSNLMRKPDKSALAPKLCPWPFPPLYCPWLWYCYQDRKRSLVPKTISINNTK